MPDQVIVREPIVRQVVIREQETPVVKVKAQGPQGPQGPQGSQGVQGNEGPPGEGGTSDVKYIHDQSIPQITWNINHNLDKMPSVTVVDSAGTTVEGNITYVNTNSLTIEFSSSFSGKAFLN